MYLTSPGHAGGGGGGPVCGGFIWLLISMCDVAVLFLLGVWGLSGLPPCNLEYLMTARK